MAVTSPTTFRFSEQDRATIKEVAQRLQRTQTDVVRIVCRELLIVLRENDAPKKRKGNRLVEVRSRKVGL